MSRRPARDLLRIGTDTERKVTELETTPNAWSELRESQQAPDLAQIPLQHKRAVNAAHAPARPGLGSRAVPTEPISAPPRTA